MTLKFLRKPKKCTLQQKCTARTKNVTAMEKFAWSQIIKKGIVLLETYLSTVEHFVAEQMVHGLLSLGELSAESLALVILCV